MHDETVAQVRTYIVVLLHYTVAIIAGSYVRRLRGLQLMIAIRK